MCPIEFVKEQYRLLFEDKEEFLKNCSADITWIVNGPAELTKCGRFSGRDGVRDFFKKLDSNWEFDAPIEIAEIFEVPHRDLVVGITKEKGKNRITGKQFVARGTHLWKISPRGPDGDRTGRKVLGFTEFLCVWDGPEEIALVPKMESLILGIPSSTTEDLDETKKASLLMPDPGSLHKPEGSKGNHFGISGGDTN